ncbi:MAG: hypothetical protein U5K69_09065 [Balneolaceae bacterium]|nr:hypothetical protein [Balneolaceae bacterium]
MSPPFAEKKNPAKIIQEINQYNQIKESIATKHGVHFVNITSISRKAESNPALLAEDQLHPSGKMCCMWVDKALPVIVNEIKTMDSQNR